MHKSTMPLSPQCAAILYELRQGPRTTLQLSRSLGILCVGTRVHELRAVGHNIETRLIDVSNRRREHCTVAQYSLARRRGARVVRDSGKRAAKRA